MVDHEDDVIQESVNGGMDTVLASRSYMLPANVENLTLTGGLSIDATGNVLGNMLVSNDGDNVLKGKEKWSGARDTGIGATATIPTSISRTSSSKRMAASIPGITSSADGCRKMSRSTTSEMARPPTTSMPSRLTVMRWTISSIPATPGWHLQRHSRWRAGADTMVALGRDSAVFYVDNINDVVVASALGSDYDEVRTDLDYQLGDHVENLVLLGQQRTKGIGNELNNTLDGAQNNAENTLQGGLGNDRYRIDARDKVIELGGEATTPSSSGPPATHHLPWLTMPT